MRHTVLFLSLEFIREAIKWTIFHSWTEYFPNVRAFSIRCRKCEVEFGRTLPPFLSLSHFLLEFLVNNFSPNFVCECKKVVAGSLGAIKNFLKFHAQLMTSLEFIPFHIFFRHILDDTLNVYNMRILENNAVLFL